MRYKVVRVIREKRADGRHGFILGHLYAYENHGNSGPNKYRSSNFLKKVLQLIWQCTLQYLSFNMGNNFVISFFLTSFHNLGTTYASVQWSGILKKNGVTKLAACNIIE